jgi:hypothetical protein
MLCGLLRNPLWKGMDQRYQPLFMALWEQHMTRLRIFWKTSSNLVTCVTKTMSDRWRLQYMLCSHLWPDPWGKVKPCDIIYQSYWNWERLVDLMVFETNALGIFQEDQWYIRHICLITAFGCPIFQSLGLQQNYKFTDTRKDRNFHKI